jgi:tetratricopeptide (TPR) repeat protein
MKVKQVSDLVTVDYPFWLVPDVDHLRSVMRYVYTYRDKARERGQCAGTILRSIHTWANAATIAERRIRSLMDESVPLGNETTLLTRNTKIDKGISLLQMGAYNEAISIFQKILLLHGENSLAYEGLAIAAFYKKNYDEACHLFAAANRISNDTIDILVNWYEAAKMVDATDQLIEPVSKAMQFHRDNDELRSIAVEIGIL